MEKDKIFKKLRLNVNGNNLILNAPEAYRALLKDVTADLEVKVNKKAPYEFIQVFATDQNELEQQLKLAVPGGKYDAVFWACYPKGTGKIKSNIKRDTVWNAFQSVGLRAVTSVSIDDTWTALRARPHLAVGK